MVVRRKFLLLKKYERCKICLTCMDGGTEVRRDRGAEGQRGVCPSSEEKNVKIYMYMSTYNKR